MTNERLKLIVDEFGRIPEADEIRDVYRNFFREFGRSVPVGALSAIAALEKGESRDDLEQRIEKNEAKIQKYQRKITRNIYKKKKTIVPFGVGTGKTQPAIAASAAINSFDKPMQTVAITPKTNQLKDQWASRINKYSIDKKKIAIINNSRYTSPLDNVNVLWDPTILESKQILKEADFVITNYHMVPKWAHLLPREAYGIVDEAHNHIDGSKRIASAIREATSDFPYLALLSATPMPCRIQDIEHQISLLSGDSNFKFPADIKSRPHLVRQLLRPYMIFPVETLDGKLRNSKEKLIEKAEHDVSVELSPEHYEFYDTLFDARGSDLIRYTALRQAAFDPSLLFRERKGTKKKIGKLADSAGLSVPEFESKIYGKVADIVSKKFSLGEKSVVYSEFISGVGDKMKRILEEKGVPTLVYEGRNRNLKKTLFQIEPEVGAIFGTAKSIAEGASYTAANNCVFMNPFFEDRVRVQGAGRIFRYGQEKDHVNIFNLVGKDTISEGIFNQTKIKSAGISAVIYGESMSEDQIDEVFRKGNIVSSPKVRKYLHSLNSKELANRLIGICTGSSSDGLEKILRAKVDFTKELSGSIGEIFAKYYNENFDGSYQANVARVYSQVLGNFNLGKILDAAGGAATASRILGVPTTVVDINGSQLEAGRIACERLGIDNEYVLSPLQTMNVGEEEFDSVVYSLGLQWATKKDRVKILENLNRAQRKGGKLVLTLSKNGLDEGMDECLVEGIEKIGYRVIEEYTGGIRSLEDSDFGAYLLFAEKERGVEGKVDEDYFALKDRNVGGRLKKGGSVEMALGDLIDKLYRRNGEEKRGVLGEFVFEDGRSVAGGEYVYGDIVSKLEGLSYGEVGGLGKRLVKEYKPGVLYDTCVKLVDEVDGVDGEMDRKMTRLFDVIGGVIGGGNGK